MFRHYKNILKKASKKKKIEAFYKSIKEDYENKDKKDCKKEETNILRK